MGTEKRRSREKARRAETIVDAAEKVILEKGFEAATMDEIAESAELSKGALYLYFRSKAELYLAICLRGSNELNSRFAAVLASRNSGLEMIRKMGEEYLDFVKNKPLYFRAFSYYESIQDFEFLQESGYAELCEKNSSQALTYMSRALQAGMQDGTIDNRYDPMELALVIWSSSRGIVQMAFLKHSSPHRNILNEVEIDIQSMFGSYIEILSNGMSAESKKRID
ncbi:MAG: TetR/AcrR family transcriptional regulator [Balneolaceae bacterium]